MVTPDGALPRPRSQSSPDFGPHRADAGLPHHDLVPIRPIWERGEAVLLQYVEQQYRDGRTTRRLSTALFTAEPDAPCGVVWRHLQETWMRMPDHEPGK